MPHLLGTLTNFSNASLELDFQVNANGLFLPGLLRAPVSYRPVDLVLLVPVRLYNNSVDLVDLPVHL